MIDVITIYEVFIMQNTLALPDSPGPKLMTAREVIQLLRIGKSTFYEYVKKGLLPRPVNIGPRTKRWLESEIYDHLLRGRKPD